MRPSPSSELKRTALQKEYRTMQAKINPHRKISVCNLNFKKALQQ
jgi:hypothetical protein